MNLSMLKNIWPKVFSVWSKPTIGLLKITGKIDGAMTYEFGKSLNNVSKKVKGLAIVINSHGGQPGQCQIIVDKLKTFSKTNNVPIYTFSEDYATSGGYYILAIGDEVHADNTSIVGGIGTISSYVNVSKLTKKYGLQYENYTTNKKTLMNQLNWFEKEPRKQDRSEIEKILNETDKLFIDHIETHRGTKLTANKGDRRNAIYDGNMWSGKQAKQLGLVDNLGNFEAILAEKFPDYRIVDYTRKTFWERTEIFLSKFNKSSKYARIYALINKQKERIVV